MRFTRAPLRRFPPRRRRAAQPPTVARRCDGAAAPGDGTGRSPTPWRAVTLGRVDDASPLTITSEVPIPPGYPAEWDADVVLSDGGTARVRPIRPDDGPRILDFHGRQSPESIYFRYFTPAPAPQRRRGRPPRQRRLRRPHGVHRPARRRDGRGGPLRPLAAAVRGRGGVLRRRRAPGEGHRHGAARIPGRGGPPGGHQRLHRHRPADEHPHGGGVPAGRVRGPQHVRRGRDRGPPRPAADAGGRGRHRGPGPAGRGRGGAPAAGAPVGGGGRRRPRAHGCRPRSAAQPAGPRLQRARVPGEPAHRPRRRRTGGRRHRRHRGPRRPGGRRRAGGPGARRDRGLRARRGSRPSSSSPPASPSRAPRARRSRRPRCGRRAGSGSGCWGPTASA